MAIANATLPAVAVHIAPDREREMPSLGWWADAHSVRFVCGHSLLGTAGPPCWRVVAVHQLSVWRVVMGCAIRVIDVVAWWLLMVYCCAVMAAGGILRCSRRGNP